MPAGVGRARGEAWALAAIPAALTVSALASGEPQLWLGVTLVAGLLIFRAVFAVNSVLHSYLILAFTKAERVTRNVGLYYMAHAGGRLPATLSGPTCQVGGLPFLPGTAKFMVGLSALAAGRLMETKPEVTPG